MRVLSLLTAAALLSISPAVLAAPSASAPSAKDRAEAKARAAEGRKRMKDKRWVEAIVALKKAEKLDPSPALAVEVAEAQIGAGKLVEAQKTLSAVADGTESAPAAKRAHAAAKKALADLKARVPTVTVKATGAPPGKVTALVDGIEVEGTDDIAVNPGDHTISAAAEGFVNAEKDVHFDEGAHQRITLQLASATRPVADAEGESKKSGSRVPGAVVTTIGGVGLAVGGIFGALAFSASSSAKSQCTGNACPPSAADDISRSKTFGNVSTGLFIGGGAVAVTGIILLIAAPGGGGGKSDDARPSAGLTGLAPWVSAGSAGVGAAGRF